MDVERITGLSGRARLHAALSDTTRLAIVEALALGDATPSELRQFLGIPSNLLAHHLKVLETEGLVSRTRSEADRRRSYVHLNHAALGSISLSVHLQATRIVFVCTANSARSQLAAALWRRASRLPVASAGTHPARHVEPGAVSAARRHDLPMRARRPRPLAEVAVDSDLIITVCDTAHEELGRRANIHWSIPDPVRRGTDRAFDDVIDALTQRIRGLAPALQAG